MTAPDVVSEMPGTVVTPMGGLRRTGRVEVGAFSLIGGRLVERPAELPASAPVVRIRAWSLVGGVRVRVQG